MLKLQEKPRLSRVVIFLISMSAVSHVHAVTVEFQDENYEFTVEERDVVQSIADDTEIEVRKLLPSLDTDIVLVVSSSKYVIDITGEGGMAMSAGQVLWTVDHERPGGVIGIANAHLRHTLFHEFHHLVRGWLIEGGMPKNSFMVGVVSEGMATAFARDFSGEDAPWSKYPDDVDGWVYELQSVATGDRYAEWMFLHPDGRKWIGYRAGTFLVDLAMEATGKNSADLVNVSADEIIELGKLPRLPGA